MIRIEVGGGLVETEHAAALHQRLGDEQQLTLARTQRRKRLVGLDPVGFEPLQGFAAGVGVDTPERFEMRVAPQQHEIECAHVGVVAEQFGGNVGDDTCPFARRVIRQGPAKQRDVAVKRQQAAQRFEQGAFADTVGTEDTEVPVGFEGDVSEHGNVVAARKIANTDHCRASHRVVIVRSMRGPGISR